MMDVVLIGSRALSFFLPSRCIDDDSTDYDLIATESAAKQWIAKMPGEVKCDITKYPLEYEKYRMDIDRDIRNWKHLDSNLGNELFHNTLSKVKDVSKIHGFVGSKRFEIEIATPGSSAEFLLQIVNRQNSSAHSLKRDPIHEYWIADLSLLEAIKTSHIIFPIEWQKHNSDLQLLRDCIGRSKNNYHAPIRSKELECFILHRRIEHYLRLGVPGAHLHLNMRNDDFLENEVNLLVDRYIEHDKIHPLVRMGEKPAYDDLRRDKSKALMDKDLFDTAPENVRFNCVQEEAMVIALERYLLPARNKDPQESYTRALNRICTTLTKGWFREFAINIFPHVSKVPKDLMPIQAKIMEDYEKLEAKKRKRMEKLDKKKKNEEIIRTLSETKGLKYRIQKLFPLVFQEERELDLARKMALATILDRFGVYRCSFVYEKLQAEEHTSSSNKSDDLKEENDETDEDDDSDEDEESQESYVSEDEDENNQYDRCGSGYEDLAKREDQKPFDFCFRAKSRYRFAKKGWCESYSRWHLYVIATQASKYRECLDPDSFMSMEYDDISTHKSREYDDRVRLAMSIEKSEDDSYHPTPDLGNLYTSSLDGIATMSPHPLITSDFLMKFILCVTYPAKLRSGLHGYMPRSKVHYLYELWKNPESYRTKYDY